MADDVRRFLPTLDDARERGLLEGMSGEPYEEHPLCGLVVRATVFRSMSEIYVPRAMRTMAALHGFESAFESAITTIGKAPPDCLRCHDLRPRRTGGGYRAAQETREPDFHGHRFSDTIAQAEEDLQQFFLGEQKAARQRESDIRSYDVLAWAWPLLWLRYTGGSATEVVLYVDGSGQRAVFRGRPPAED